MTRAPALHTTDARGQSDQPSGASPLSDLAARPVDVTLTASREARERGNVRRAEVCDRKAQFWLDRYNRLIGNGLGGVALPIYQFPDLFVRVAQPGAAAGQSVGGDCARRAGRSS